MKSLLIQLLILLIPLCAVGLPYGSLEDLYSPEYDYDEDNEVSEEGDVMKAPGFVSETMNLVVNEGETIRLPCIVTRLQGFVLLWKKNDNIITVGDQILGSADSRYYLEAKENGNNLMISLAEPGDEGEFVCQVSAFKPTQIHHSVKIRVRPSIQTSPVKSLTVKEGEEARLYCRVVAGDPKPNLKWRRKGSKMPTGDKEIMGEVIIFESVTRHHEGTYECVTEDDYGFEPITREVQLHVEYAPVIEQEQTYIKTEAGEEIHVTCIVHAYPEPQVVWAKDGQPIHEDSAGFVINRSGDRHNLILLVVKKEFFGDYSCRARNEFGVATKSAHVSGEFETFTDFSTEKPQNYPKLDIRNFYLESLGDSDFSATGLAHEGEISEDGKDLKGLRIFSYLKHLRESINPEGIEKFRSATFRKKIERAEHVDDNQEVDKVAQSLGVTDMTDDKYMTKSFRGSFSDLSDLHEIDNLQEIEIEENKEETREDIGWGWYSKKAHYVNTNDISTTKKDNELSESRDKDDMEDNESNKSDLLVSFDSKKEDRSPKAEDKTPSVEMTSSYRGSFSQHSDLDEIGALEEGERAHISDDKTLVDAKDGYYSSPRYLDSSNQSPIKYSTLTNAQTKEVIEESFDSEDQSKYESSNLAFHQEEEKSDLYPDNSSPRYPDISEEGSALVEIKDMNKESSGEVEQEDETGIFVYIQDTDEDKEGVTDEVQVGEPMEDHGLSSEEILSEKLKEDESHQKAVPGDMFLTTSIVTEQIGETHLENKSPYEKPYIIPQLSKEQILSENRKYSYVEKDELEKANDINLRPYPIYIKKNKEDVKFKEYEDENENGPLIFQTEKEIVEETTEYEDESITPLMIHVTQGKHTFTNEYSEENEDDLIPPIMNIWQVEASQFKQTNNEEGIKSTPQTADSHDKNVEISANIGMQGIRDFESSQTEMEESGESEVTIEKIGDTVETDVKVESLGASNEDESYEYDYDENNIESHDEYDTEHETESENQAVDDTEKISNIGHTTEMEEPSETKVDLQMTGDSDEIEVVSEKIGESAANDIDDNEEDEYEGYDIKSPDEYKIESHTAIEDATESEHEAEEGLEKDDTFVGTTDSHVDERDKSEISESTSETVTTPWEAESEEDLESNPSVLEKNIETEEPDYVDYSYAEIAAQEKTSGTKYETDNVMPPKVRRKEKSKKKVPWLKKFKFVMVGNKVVMVLRKAI